MTQKLFLPVYSKEGKKIKLIPLLLQVKNTAHCSRVIQVIYLFHRLPFQAGQLFPDFVRTLLCMSKTCHMWTEAQLSISQISPETLHFSYFTFTAACCFPPSGKISIDFLFSLIFKSVLHSVLPPHVNSANQRNVLIATLIFSHFDFQATPFLYCLL